MFVSPNCCLQGADYGWWLKGKWCIPGVICALEAGEGGTQKVVLWGWQQLPPISCLSRKGKGSCARLPVVIPASDSEPCHEQSREAFKADALINNQKLMGWPLLIHWHCSMPLSTNSEQAWACIYLFRVEDAGSEGSAGNLSGRRTAASRIFSGHWKYFLEIKLVGKTWLWQFHQ